MAALVNSKLSWSESWVASHPSFSICLFLSWAINSIPVIVSCLLVALTFVSHWVVLFAGHLYELMEFQSAVKGPFVGVCVPLISVQVHDHLFLPLKLISL